MMVYVFGNPDLAADSLPLRILPALRQRFPTLTFLVIDPNEEWDLPEELVMIDTVLGITEAHVFTDLKSFSPAPNVGLHDFDAYANLRYLQKLGRLKNIKIIGVPPTMDADEALVAVAEILEKHFPRRKKLRLPDFDYSQTGYYFVTICVKDRKCLFGNIVDGKMVLNEVGKIVEREWKKTPEVRNNVSIDFFVVMPNHVHGIVIIEEKMDRKNVGAYCNTPLRSPSHTIGSIIRGFKSASAVNIKKYTMENSYSGGVWQYTPTKIWQRNYYEHIIRDEKSLEKIREYIINNPLQWELDAENPNQCRGNS